VPIPHDPVLAAENARKRQEIESSGAWQRGQAQAKANDLRNTQERYNTVIADLRRHAITRDKNVPSRDRYNLTHKNAVRAAEALFLATGTAVPVPAWLPPPDATTEETVMVTVAPAVTPIVEPRGRSGLPLTGPGSNTDPMWSRIP
jgi:hypothetical protein